MTSRAIALAIALAIPLSCATSHKLDAQKTTGSDTVTNTDATKTTTVLPSSVVKFGPTGVATEVAYYSGSIETLKTISQLQAKVSELTKIHDEGKSKASFDVFGLLPWIAAAVSLLLAFRRYIPVLKLLPF